jgi:hypothetical protein
VVRGTVVEGRLGDSDVFLGPRGRRGRVRELLVVHVQIERDTDHRRELIDEERDHIRP